MTLFPGTKKHHCKRLLQFGEVHSFRHHPCILVANEVKFEHYFSAHQMPSVTKHANPRSLEGVTLEAIVTHLSETIGWEAMAAAVKVRCFAHEPSIKSSLKFLRRTPWARRQVEQLYLQQGVTGC